MSENTRGIEIVKQQGQKAVEISVGGESVSAKGEPLDVQLVQQHAYVYLLIDCSGSMNKNKLDQAKQGVIDFATDAILNKYKVGLICFETDARLVCEPISDIQGLAIGVNALRVGGGTNMVKAIRIAHDKLKHLSGTRVVVIATDGMPDDTKATLKVAQAAKNDGIEFIAIGTDDANKDFLGKLATRQGLSTKVASAVFSQAIASASSMLPPPRGLIKR